MITYSMISEKNSCNPLSTTAYIKVERLIPLVTFFDLLICDKNCSSYY